MDDELKRRLTPLRERIDQIDAQILTLINQRAQAALEVGEIKPVSYTHLTLPTKA